MTEIFEKEEIQQNEIAQRVPVFLKTREKNENEMCKSKI